GLDVDGAGRLLVTASDDKSARLWSLTDGRLLRVLRPPIGGGNEGKLYTAALTPDGTLVAVAGSTGDEWDDHSGIYIFDTTSGRMVRRIPGLPKVVEKLAITSDGSRIAAVTYSEGVRVFSLRDGAMIAGDTDYSREAFGVAYAPDGKLATSSYDA